MHGYQRRRHRLSCTWIPQRELVLACRHRQPRSCWSSYCAISYNPRDNCEDPPYHEITVPSADERSDLVVRYRAIFYAERLRLDPLADIYRKYLIMRRCDHIKVFARHDSNEHPPRYDTTRTLISVVSDQSTFPWYGEYTACLLPILLPGVRGDREGRGIV